MPTREARLRAKELAAQRAAAAAAPAQGEMAQLVNAPDATIPTGAKKAFLKKPAKPVTKLAAASDVARVKRKYTKRKERAKEKRPRRMPRPDPTTLLGRIDLRLALMGLQRRDLTAHLHVSPSVLSSLGRGERQTMQPNNMERTAKFLKVTVDWLANGGPLPPALTNGHALDLPTPVKPVMAKPVTVRAANGHGKAEAATGQHLDAAMTSLWSIAPLDVKALFISKMAELVAHNARH